MKKVLRFYSHSASSLIIVGPQRGLRRFDCNYFRCLTVSHKDLHSHSNIYFMREITFTYESSLTNAFFGRPSTGHGLDQCSVYNWCQALNSFSIYLCKALLAPEAEADPVPLPSAQWRKLTTIIRVGVDSLYFNVVYFKVVTECGIRGFGNGAFFYVNNLYVNVVYLLLWNNHFAGFSSF